MIKPKQIPVQVVEHFDPNGKSLGSLNEHENLDLRRQIAEQKISGYYMIFNCEKIEIMPDGKIKVWPPGLYDINEILLAELFKTQRNILINKF